MTQEDKELLLKDLCARLPYGVKCKAIYWRNRDKDICDLKRHKICINFSNISLLNRDDVDIKPYLFPLSSMREEQNDSWRDAWFPDLMTSTDVNYPESEKYLAISHAKSLDWLYKNHIDIYGFIEKGLALDATGLNIYN